MEREPDVPEAKAQSPDEQSLASRPAIPLRPRVPAPPSEEVELEVDPPESQEAETEAENPAPPPQPRRVEAPSAALPADEASPDRPTSLRIRPREVEGDELEEIKQRAEENTKGEQALPAVAPLPMKPRAPKIDPSQDVEIIEEETLGGDGDTADEQVRLQDRKTGVSRLLNEVDLAQQSALLEEADRPTWEREAGASDSGSVGHDEAVNMLTPDAETGSYQWVSLTPEDMLSPAAKRRRRLFRKALLALLGIVTLGAAAIFGRNAYIAMQQSEEEVAEQEATPIASLSLEEIAAADALARRWASITDPDEMKPLVRKPKRVHPMMAESYSAAPPQPIELGELREKKKLIKPAGTFIVLAYLTSDDVGFRFVTVEQTPTGEYLIDWELSTYHQPMTLSEFMAEKPSTPTSFRVLAEPDNYYDHIFTPEEFVCYRLTYPGTDFRLFGYARRDSNAAEILFVQTAGRALSLVLDLRYLEDPLRDDRVEITDVAKLDWFY